MESESFVIVETSLRRPFALVTATPRSTAAHFLPLLSRPATIRYGPNPKSLQALKAMSQRRRHRKGMDIFRFREIRASDIGARLGLSSDNYQRHSGGAGNSPPGIRITSSLCGSCLFILTKKGQA